MWAKDLLARALIFADSNSAEIALGTAIAGVPLVAILSGRARLKADDILMNMELEREEEFGITDPIPTPEKIKATWKCYTLPVLAVGGTIWMMIWSHKIQGRKLVALASAYTITDSAFKEYKNKVQELVSKKKLQEIEHGICQDKVADMSMLDGDILSTNRGDVLCVDYWNGMKFFSNATEIKEAVARCNNMMADSLFLSEATVYDEIGIPILTTTAGNAIPAEATEIGWNRLRDKSIRVDLDTCLDKENIPTLVMRLEPKPYPQFEDF